MEMSDEIGYQPTKDDIQAVVRWLSINNEENANPEYARGLLIATRDMFRELGSIDEDLLYKALEKYKSENN